MVHVEEKNEGQLSMVRGFSPDFMWLHHWEQRFLWSLRGRPYKGRICAFGKEVFALDLLQVKYVSQWRRGIWLTKDNADMDIVTVSRTEIIRSRAIRKVFEHWNAEFALALEVGPWDMRRGVNTEVRPAMASQSGCESIASTSWTW